MPPPPQCCFIQCYFICHLGIDTTVCGWQVLKNSLVDGNNLLMTYLICRHQQNKQKQISWPSCVCLDCGRAFVIDVIRFLSRTIKQLSISPLWSSPSRVRERPFWMQKALQWHFAIHLGYEGPYQIFFFLSLHKFPWALQDLEAGFIKGLLLRASQNSDIVIRHSSGFEYKLSPWLLSLCVLYTRLDLVGLCNSCSWLCLLCLTLFWFL